MSKSFISEVEGGVTQPRGPMLVKLATALAASIDFLLTGREPEPPPQGAIEIPPELASFAKKQDVPYSHLELLLSFIHQVRAMRREGPPRHLSERDWELLYEQLQPVIEGQGKK